MVRILLLQVKIGCLQRLSTATQDITTTTIIIVTILQRSVFDVPHIQLATSLQHYHQQRSGFPMSNVAAMHASYFLVFSMDVRSLVLNLMKQCVLSVILESAHT